MHAATSNSHLLAIAVSEPSPGPTNLGRGAMTITAERLYLAHRDRVYQLCLRLGGGQVPWAEDAAQDVFVKLLSRLDALGDTDDLGGWVYRVTVNTCLTRLKRERSVWRRVAAALTATGRAAADADRSTPEHQLALREDLAEATRAVASLPPTERVVFTMRHLDELPQRQIAETLSLSEGYVSKLLKRGRQRLAARGWEAADA